MPDDGAKQRIDRLARRAKALDDMIQRAAKMQKRIVEEIRQIGRADKVTAQRSTPIPKARRKRRNARIKQT